MKRKLFCIFLMLAGAAALAGTILFSLGRSEYADTSPVITLIILSIVTIVTAARRFNYNPDTPEVSGGEVEADTPEVSKSEIEADTPEISGREKSFLRIFRITGILAILVCLAFIVIMFFLTRYFSDIFFQYVFLLMLLASAGITAAVLSLKVYPPITGRDIAKAAIALAIAAALGFVYLAYMPKYSLDDGIKILRSDEEFAQSDVYYVISSYGWVYIADSPRYDEYTESLFGGNPFYKGLYAYDCDSYGYDANGLHDLKRRIYFNPATRKYEFIRTEYSDKTYSSGDYPEFNYNFLYDKDGQHNAVFNLYFREYSCYGKDFPLKDMPRKFLSVSSGEWDAVLDDVMYPNNFPEGEARAFLRSIGEQTLKTILLERINKIDFKVVLTEKGWAVIDTKDKAIKVFFFGIDIATYQNGEIELKL